MNIFLKYLLKSTFSKKKRSLLLLFTISISGTLLMGSMGALRAGNKAYEEQVRSACGDYNVIITANNMSKTPFFDKNRISKDGFETFVPGIKVSGYLAEDDTANVVIGGVSPEDYSKLPNMRIIAKDHITSLDGDKIIISEKISKAYGLKLRDNLKVNVRGKEKTFNILAIAETNGEFSKDSKNQFTVIANEETVSELWGIEDLYNVMIVKLKNSVDAKDFVKNFNQKESECLAKITFDKDELDKDAKVVSLFFFFMLLIVVFMSSFIIYSCFKLIIMERMPVIGTFLSQGETKVGIIKLLLGESLIYGIISAVIAMLLGAGLIYLLADILIKFKGYGVPTTVDYDKSYFIAGAAFAIIIPLISALLPVLSTRKFEVKDVILNTINVSSKESYKLPIIGGIIALTAIAINSLNNSISVKLSPILFFLFLIGAVMALPAVCKIIAYPLMKLLENINIIFKLALNNIRTSKVLLNNIRIVAIGLISITVIISFSTSYKNAMIGISKDYDYDVVIYQQNDPSRIEPPDPARIQSVINNNKNVEKVIQVYYAKDGEVNGSNSKVVIQGINPETYMSYDNYIEIDNKNKLYEKLAKKERNAAICYKIAKRLNKSKDEKIVLKTNNKEAEYNVIGTFNSKLVSDMILINKDNLAKDFDVSVPSTYCLQISGDANEIKASLQKELMGTSTRIMTYDEDVKANIEGISFLISVLLFFSLMTAVLGMVGIMNNIGVSFIQRKKSLMVLSSVGMTNTGNGMMMLIEGVITSILAAGLGGITSYFAVNISNNLVKLIGMDIPIEYDFKAFFIISIGILALTILSSSSAVLKCSKLSVMQELKYE